MPQLAFRCPLCAEPFQVAPSDQGQAVACPHCERAVAIPRSAADAAEQPGQGPVLDENRVERAPGRQADRDPPPGRAPAEPNPWSFVENHDRRVIANLERGDEARSLTRQERAALRRRANLLVFALSAAILGVAVVCLLLWRG